LSRRCDDLIFLRARCRVEGTDYAGSRPLMPNFGLRIFNTGAKLFVQGTKQRALELAAVERDVFVAESVGAEIDFTRYVGDKVISLILKQRGQVLPGERNPGATGANEQ
jgi:hypothetical protein